MMLSWEVEKTEIGERLMVTKIRSKKPVIKNTSTKVLDKYIAAAEKLAIKGELPKITDKSKLSTEDILKKSLCKIFVQYLNQHRMKPSDLYKLTGIDITRISEIINYKVSKLKIDQLFKNLRVLADYSVEIREHLNFIECMISMPLRKASEAKKFTNSIIQISNSAKARTI
jgi:predicted XRE-type DNA-binding protein